MARYKYVKDAWEQIFEDYEILDKVKKDGSFKITANQIRKYKEPRLMTKFDEYDSFPNIFKKNKLSILSTSFSDYIIGKFENYAEIPFEELANERATPFKPIDLCSLNVNMLNNENSTILMAFNSELLNKAFNVENLNLTIYGRMRTGEFDFNVDLKDNREKIKKQFTVSVKGSQIEIDAGFESEDAIYLIEAKKRYVKDINIRQIYFPYRLWKEKVPDKEIIPIFFVFNDNTFYLFKCVFEDLENMSSMKVTDKFKFIIREEGSFTQRDVENILSETTPRVIEAIFPQANDFPKVIDIIDQLNELGPQKKDFFTEFFQFDPRQTDYYYNAARFLGFVHRKKENIALTEKGREIVNLPSEKRHAAFVKSMVEDIVFHKCVQKTLDDGEIPDVQYIGNLINEYYQLNGSLTLDTSVKKKSSTSERRGSTVKSWIDWIIRNLDA